MRLGSFAIVAASLLSCASYASAELDQPQMRNGYVSAITSPTEFDLNGEHILCDAKTVFNSPLGTGSASAPCAEHIYIGEPLAVVQYSRKGDVFHATMLNVNNMPTHMKVTGYGILDLPLAPETTRIHGLLHADGRRLRLTARTQLTLEPPIASLADVHPSDWIAYEGRPEADGTLSVTAIAIARNTVSDREAKLLKHISARVMPPDYAAKKTGDIYFFASKHPWARIVADQSMQERVQSIGAKLVPAWQRALSENDPLRIHFQFFVVTRKPIAHDSISFPDGTILIPEKIARDLATDSELAAVIAANMAEVLEKQASRYMSAKEILGATNLAALGVGFAPVPFLGTGMVIGTAIAANEMQRRTREQADRVSLALLHEAGYDINQSFQARNAIVHKGKTDVLPYTLRAENLLADIGDWNAPALVHLDQAQPAESGWHSGHQ
jgi:hypothetical protein